jgi:hypothetical protein
MKHAKRKPRSLIGALATACAAVLVLIQGIETSADALSTEEFNGHTAESDVMEATLRSSKTARGNTINEAVFMDARADRNDMFFSGYNCTLGEGQADYDFSVDDMKKYAPRAQVSNQLLFLNAKMDDKGEVLTGAHKYVLHLPKDQLLRATTLWNMAMNAEDILFLENNFRRYSIGSTTAGLKENPDGSITIYIQKDRPNNTSNWLPAPAGPFSLTFRFYGPLTPVLDGWYRLPVVQRAESPGTDRGAVNLK